ncbi:hypothetical protein BurJ1DRAFT_0291 [Burkholderiales bacterium JOSHI_001]|nr:hypothetical protein BurJ1DRAFT_0291 [Burkholderiales bacterium JOSHI_001]
MPVAPTAESHAPFLMEIIQFKWLMVGAGHRVHVERMQSDRDYAQHCLQLGADARLDSVRHCAHQLARQLGLPQPH